LPTRWRAPNISRSALAEQESHKWLDAYATLQGVAPQLPNTTPVSIGELEADLFELFALARDPQSPRILVRANKGRGRQVVEDATLTPLRTHIAGLKAAGQLELQLPRRGGRRARGAELKVRFAKVAIKAPKQCGPLNLWAVHLWERDLPANTEAVEWLLLTDAPTTTLKEALERALVQCPLGY